MKAFGEKHPIIFEFLLFVIGVLLAGVTAGVLNVFGCSDEISGAIARILIGFAFLAAFHRCFRFDAFFRGFVPMLPALLLAIYKIPYHFVSGGGAINPVTVPVLLVGLAPAVFEEVLFRGIFIFNLKKRFNSPTAIVLVSAIVFSLVHLTNVFGMDMASLLLQLMMALAAGIVFGAIYLYTEDLISVITAHFAVDVLGGIFSGGQTTPYYFLVILAALWVVEIVYGFLLVRAITDKE